MDDEPPAVARLAMLVGEMPGVEIVRTYLSPGDALEEAKTLLPQIAFLDIHMPDMDGLTLAEKLTEVSPETAVVFVTAFDRYAVKAFELSACDYLLKPVERDRLEKTVKKAWQLQRLRTGETAKKEAVAVKCFGIFEAATASGPICFSAAKVEELFAYLLLQPGKRRHKYDIIEDLFSPLPADRAATYLHTCVYQLRKALRNSEADGSIRLEYARESYRLWVQGVKIDVEAFCRTAEEGLKSNELSKLEEAISLYGGELLSKLDVLWSKGIEQELARLMGRVRSRYVHELCRRGKAAEALRYLKQELGRNPAHEECNLLMVDVLAYAGELRSAKKHYAEYCRLLQEELGVTDYPGFDRRTKTF